MHNTFLQLAKGYSLAGCRWWLRSGCGANKFIGGTHPVGEDHEIERPATACLELANLVHIKEAAPYREVDPLCLFATSSFAFVGWWFRRRLVFLVFSQFRLCDTQKAKQAQQHNSSTSDPITVN